MPEQGTGLRSAASWYVLGSLMLAAALGGVLAPPSGAKWISVAGLVLGGAALALSARWKDIFPQREFGLARGVLALFCVAQAVHCITRAAGGAEELHGVDFSAYYLPGSALQEKPPQSLYDLPMFADGRMDLNTEDAPGSRWYALAQRHDVPFAAPYIYPPFLAGLMRPLARLSFAQALAAWNLLTVLLTAAALGLTFDLAGVRMNARLALVAGIGLFSFFPFLDNLFFGQMGGVILFLFAAGVWLLSRRLVGLSALCFAVATLIKLTPVLIVPMLIVHRRWRWAAAYALWTAGLLAFSVGMTGWHAHAEFCSMRCCPAMSCGSAVWQNSSLVSWVQQLFLGYAPDAKTPSHVLPAYACAASKIAAALVYGAFLAQCWRRRNRQSVELAMVGMVLLGLAISPITWWHHYTIALLPLIYLWWRMPDRAGRRWLAALGLVAGTNAIGLAGLVMTSSAVRLVLGGIGPLLTIVVAFAAVSGREESEGACAA